MHDAAYRWVERHATDKIVKVLEIGSRDINGTVRELFPNAVRYVGVDIADGIGVNIVADAAELCLDEMFDVAVSTEVLEHAERWRDIVQRMAAHLVPGGHLILTAAGPGRAPHSATGGPVGDEYYANVSVGDLLNVLAGCGLRCVAVDQTGDDIRAYAIKG